ncbi:hypothetical protein [Streptomyces sp. NPDC058401]|uniref:MmyB family transcriptional regulator n=1 Tax=Streptomyces sp. NPDC058401 TaxID=3346480 RepID=UPI003653E125
MNVLRLALHPEGMGPRVVNLAAWGRHITESLRTRASAHPDPDLEALAEELHGYLAVAAPLPGARPGSGAASSGLADGAGSGPCRRGRGGRASGLRRAAAAADLRGGAPAAATLTSFSTAVDVTLAELRLEAFLPADAAGAELLRRREDARTGSGSRR